DQSRLLGLLEQTGAFDETFWSTAVEQGWTALALPETAGGLGLGLVELGLVAQATGAATAGAPFLTTSYGAGHVLRTIGDAEQQARWLPGLASGEAIGTVAFAEGNAPLPANPACLLTNGRLSGIKHAVTAGLKADFAVVWALHDGTPALALVELGGVTRRA